MFASSVGADPHASSAENDYEIFTPNCIFLSLGPPFNGMLPHRSTENDHANLAHHFMVCTKVLFSCETVTSSRLQDSLVHCQTVDDAAPRAIPTTRPGMLGSAAHPPQPRLRGKLMILSIQSFPLPIARVLAAGALALSAALASAQPQFSWRYYRPGNTGIQGDYNESIWIAPDGDPWISGYDPVAEEGGIAKFIQSENRWLNVSNIDYSAIGSANDVGTSRVSDMVADGQGNLWLGTWRGLLRMNLADGPSSLVRFGPSNSLLPGGRTMDVTLAPDGSIWASAISVYWGGGGLTRYQPATNTWTHFAGRAGGKIAAQSKPGGGYFLWTSGDGSSGMDRWDSTTQAWTHIAYAIGNPVALLSKDSVDDDGNMWALKLADNQGQWTLDCKRPDGTWITPPLPPRTSQLSAPFAAIKPFGALQAYLIVIAPDLTYHLHRFNGSAWTDLGSVPHNAFIDDLKFAPDGTIWVCGTGQGGALRRDPTTGVWQRYRVTNTSQFDFFNNDLSISPQTGDVYACANAGSGVGGMVKFDGTRWTGFNDFTYGLGVSWPFLTDNSDAVYVRPSTGDVVVNPTNNFTHSYNGAVWTSIPGGPDQVERYVEDSLGRLWAVGHYGGLGYFSGSTFRTVRNAGWGLALQADPDRPGTIWTNEDYEIARTDGTSTFVRSIADFPELADIGGSFTGLAADHNGIAWVGTWGQFNSSGSTLIRLNANAGTYQLWQHDLGWPFPGDHVRPQVVTPDGRIWMTYDSEYPSTDAGLLWWDGTNVGTFPAPPNGEWRFGGLPHAGIIDLEVKVIPGGYELWMSCISRGLAVLSVTSPACPADFNQDGVLNADDLGDFITGYFNTPSDPATDFNADGVINADDLGDFITAYFNGC